MNVLFICLWTTFVLCHERPEADIETLKVEPLWGTDPAWVFLIAELSLQPFRFHIFKSYSCILLTLGFIEEPFSMKIKSLKVFDRSILKTIFFPYWTILLFDAIHFSLKENELWSL